MIRFHLYNGKISLRIYTLDCSAKQLARLELHSNSRGALHHVIVCENESLWIDDKAAPDSPLWTTRLVPEQLKERIIRLWSVFLITVVLLSHLGRGSQCVYVDDSRGDAFCYLCERCRNQLRR